MHEEHRGSNFDPDNDRPSTPPAPRRSILSDLFIGLVMVVVLLGSLLPLVHSHPSGGATQSAAQRWQDRAAQVERAVEQAAASSQEASP